MNIKIGSIRIEDKNNNDFFDPSIDEIKNEKGKAIRPDSQEVKKVLDEIGIPSLERFSLLNAFYLSIAWEEASRDAFLGQPQNVKHHLERAREYYKVVNLPFEERRAAELMASAYMSAAENLLARNFNLLSVGTFFGVDPVLGMKELLTKAEAFAAVGEKEFDEGRAREMLKFTYLEYIEEELTVIESNIKNGWDDRLLSKLQKIIQYAKEGNIRLEPKRLEFLKLHSISNQEVKELLRAVGALNSAEYQEYLEKELTVTESLIEDGRDDELLSRLQKIIQYAKDGNIRLEPKRLELLKLYSHSNQEVKKLLRAYLGALKSAEAQSARGQWPTTECWLKQAEERAFLAKGKFGIDLGFEASGASEILIRAHLNDVENYFKYAEKSRSLDEIQHLLENAYLECQEWGIPFDKNRAEEILRKFHANEFSHFYRLMDQVAEYGRQVDCLGLLAVGRKYAESVGLKFDEGRARQIKKDWLLRHIVQIPEDSQAQDEIIRAIHAIDVEDAEDRGKTPLVLDQSYKIKIMREARFLNPHFHNHVFQYDPTAFYRQAYDRFVKEAKEAGKVVPSYDHWLALVHKQ